MQRFFLSPTCFLDQTVLLDEPISRQISQVLRMNVEQDQITVLDNSGMEYLVQLAGWQGKQLRGLILGQQMGKRETARAIWLCFSLTRREKLEWILQKGTEIGVAGFQPFVSERSLSREMTTDLKRQARWETIVREAAEQSRRSRLPEVRPVLPFDALVKRELPEVTKLIAWEDTEPSLRITGAVLGAGQDHNEASIQLVIGPEGGFGKAEVALAESNGYKPVSLGASTLRMETACLVGPAIIRHVLETGE